MRDALLLVQVTDGEYDLNGPELDGTLAKTLIDGALFYLEELGALKKWHDEVDA